MRVLHDPAYLSGLLGRIYDCALHPEGWRPVLAELAGLIQARRGMIGVGFVGAGDGTIAVQFGLEDFTPEVAERMGPINPLMPLVLVCPIDRAVVASRDLGLERLRATRFYREWLAPRGDSDAVGFTVTREGGALGHWVLITQEDRGPIQDDEAAGLELVAPHVRRALEISNTLGMQQLAADTFRGALDRLEAAVLIVEEGRRIVYANPRGASMLALCDVVMLRGGRIAGASGDAERALRSALGENGGRPHAGALEARVTGAGGSERLMFSVTLDLLQDNPFASPGRSTLLVLRAPREDMSNPITIAARIFRLTPTQVQVLTFLAQGHAPDDIADLIGVSVKTVRSHLAELFRRTQTTRQAELVARTLSVGSPLRASRG